MKVRNALGLHARPATIVVKILQGFKSDVLLTYKKETVNARSIMSILMLAIRKNTHVVLSAEGEDADLAILALVEAFENQFGESIR